MSLIGVGVFSVMLAVESEWDPEASDLSLDGASVVLVGMFMLICIMTLSVTGSIEGSRRRFYSIVFDKLYAREEPEAELLEEARTEDARKWFSELALGWALSLILLVGTTGVNVGVTLQGTQLAGAGGHLLTTCLVIGAIGVGGFSWLLLLRWNRRPLHTLFSTPDQDRSPTQ